MKKERIITKMIDKFFPQRFRLANLTNYPVFRNLLDRLFFEEDNMFYLTKDSVIEMNKPVEMPDNYVLPSKIVEHFIEEANYHLIMDFCICRKFDGCEDYPVELGCLFLGEAAVDVNPNLGKSVSEKEAFEHIERCREAGLVHLIGRNKLDPIWLDVAPGKKLMTICNCCPCCCLWKMIPDLHQDISGKIKKLPGIEIKINDDCIGCGECTEICFVDAIEVKEGKAEKNDECRGCGRCIEVCQKDAIDMEIRDLEFHQKSIKDLEDSLDVY